MNNKVIAKVFTDIACLLEMKEENIFKIRAYRKVAFTIEQLSEELLPSLSNAEFPQERYKDVFKT